MASESRLENAVQLKLVSLGCSLWVKPDPMWKFNHAEAAVLGGHECMPQVTGKVNLHLTASQQLPAAT